MLYHVSICVEDVERSARFYDAVLATIGMKRVHERSGFFVAYGGDHGEFWIQSPRMQDFLVVSTASHYAFTAKSADEVRAFHAAALAAGGKSAWGPKSDPAFGLNFLGCVVTDLDGNLPECFVYPHDGPDP